MTTLAELYKNSKPASGQAPPVQKKQADLNELKSAVDQVKEQIILINQQVRDAKTDLDDSKLKATVFKTEFNNFVASYNDNSKQLQDVLIDLSSRVAKVETA